MREHMGTAVGAFGLSDQDYANNAALFTENAGEWPRVLTNYDDAAQTMGLHNSWTKIKLQNIGNGPQLFPVNMQGNTVESTDSFT